MANNKPVIVYGASGYTGRLVCEYLRELGVPFIAAGRDKARVQAVLDKVPGIESADYEVVEVAHDVEALTKLFKDAKVVCNMVGPFIKFGPEAVEACLAAGCHYLDTTGEQDWMIEAKEKWGAAFAKKGLLLSPCIAQMYITGEIAANIALETPGLDTLDVLVLWKGFPTYASTQTIFTILKAKWHHLSANQYVEWPMQTRFDVAVPGQHEMALALPWGGTAHPVWFKDDPRVTNCKVAGRGDGARSDGKRRRHDQDVRGRHPAPSLQGAGGGAGPDGRFGAVGHAATGKPAHQHHDRFRARVGAARAGPLRDPWQLQL